MSLAQTYTLASKVKSKLTKEAVNPNADLRYLVCQANLLDNLMDSINHRRPVPIIDTTPSSASTPRTMPELHVRFEERTKITTTEVEEDEDDEYYYDSEDSYQSDDDEYYEYDSSDDDDDDYSSEDEDDIRVVDRTLLTVGVTSIDKLRASEPPMLSHSSSSSESENELDEEACISLTQQTNVNKTITSEVDLQEVWVC